MNAPWRSIPPLLIAFAFVWACDDDPAASVPDAAVARPDAAASDAARDAGTTGEDAVALPDAVSADTGGSGEDATGGGEDAAAGADADGEPGDAAGNTEDAAGAPFNFTDVDCRPDIAGGQTVEEGDLLSCTFRILGTTPRPVALSCRDDQAAPLDCSGADALAITPTIATPLPINDGFFNAETAGLANTTLVVHLIASDTVDEVDLRLAAMIVPRSTSSQPPVITVNCAGDSDGNVAVTAGQTLSCDLTFTDADSPSVLWSYSVLGPVTWVNEPMPFGGAGVPPLSVVWSWITTAAEAGSSWTFRFQVEDQVAPPVTYDLIVEVN